jgi:hypothetical protein
MRDAGILPISTVGNPTVTTPPCAVWLVIVQAGIPMARVSSYFLLLAEGGASPGKVGAVGAVGSLGDCGLSGIPGEPGTAAPPLLISTIVP